MGAPPVFGRYHVIEILGAGSHGRVLKVDDLEAGEVRILKVILDDARTYPLFQTFEAFKAVAHPNLIPLYDAGQDPTGISYVSAALVEGGTVGNHARGARSVGVVLEWLREALEGLAALHEAGLIHGNIKPSNVFLELGTEPGKRTARLADPGLPGVMPDTRGPSPLTWVAPECLDGGTAGVRADLYALAAVFYLALTNEPPFTASGMDALRRQKAGDAVAPPSTLRPELASEVDALLLAMLAPDPAARPASAAVVLAALDEMESGPVVAVDPAHHLHLPLTGRDKALAAVDEAVERVGMGSGRLLVFTGGSGAGKSRLLQELLVRLRKAGVSIHDAGILPALSHSEPLRRVLQGPVVGEGDLFASTLEQHRASLRPLFPERITGPLPPPLGSHEWPARGTPHHLAVADDLASLLIKVTTEPRAILIDDAQLAPPGLQRVVAQLALRLAEAPLMVALTVDPAGLPEDSPLGQALAERGIVRVELADLSRTQLEQLLEGALGEVRGMDALADEVERWSGGNPAGIELALKVAIGAEALLPTRGGWRLNLARLPQALEGLGAPGARWEGARAAAIPPGDRPLLKAVATLGLASPQTLTAALGGAMRVEDVQRDLLRLTKAGLSARDDDAGAWRVARPSLAAALAADTDRATRRLWHRRAADHLASRREEGITPERLARHWMEGGEDLKALGPGMDAVNRLTACWRFDEALEWTRRLLTLEGLSAEEAFDLRERAVGLALTAGYVDDARALAEPLLDAQLWANLPDRQWRADWLMGRLCLESGAYEEARARLESATSWIPEGVTAAERIELTTAHVVVRMLTGRPEVADGVAEGILEGADPPPDPVTARCHVRLWAVRTNVAWNRGRASLAEACAIQGSRVAETFAMRFPEAAQAVRLELGPLSLMRARACFSQGRYGDTRQSAAEALTRFAEVGNLTYMARCHELMGLSFTATGSNPEAIEQFEMMRGLAHRAHALPELSTAATHLGGLYRISGRLERAQEVLDEGLAAARDLRNRRLVGTLLGSLGEVWHRRGEFDRARRLYEEAVESLKYSSRADLLANVRRLLELTFDENKLHGFEMKVAEALTLARSNSRAVDEGNLLALLGTYAARMGRSREAMGHFRAGEEILRTAGAHYDVGRLKLRQGRVYMDLGAHAEAEGALRAAEEGFRRLGAEPDLRTAQEALKLLEENAQGSGLIQKKLEMLLEVNRSMSAILDVEKLLDVIVDKAMEFTHSERGFILLFDDEGQRTLQASRHMDRSEVAGRGNQVSSTVVERVRQTLAPVTVTHVDRDSELRSTRSVVSLGLNAVLAAPLKRGERLLGVLYLDSSRPVEEFYRRDQSLLEALADAAAIAVENAQLVTSLKRKTELMSILAHEFRSPLTATQLFVGQLLRRASDLKADDREALEGIGAQGERLGRMIDNILELSRMEADKVDWRFEPVAVSEILGDSVRGLLPVARDQGVGIVIEGVDPALTTWGSGDRLVQVCTNLLANALRFSEAGGRVIFRARIIEASPGQPRQDGGRDRWRHQEVPPGWGLSSSRRVEIALGDDGPGIPEGELEGIFERFTQGGERRGRSTGLGLSISREIVAHHGGRIWAENRERGGARFRFTLPLLERVGG